MISLFLLLFAIAAPALGKVSANVPVDYSNYSILDRLEAYGCAQPTFRALRPQGHADLKGALALTGGKDRCEAPPWLLREREILLRDLLQNDARVGLYFRHEDPLPLQGIDATVLPTYPERQGRFDYYGPNLFGEMTANAEAGQKVGVALSITPGWVGTLEDYGRPLGRFYLHEGYIKVGYGRLEATYGRIALGFGGAKHGGLILGTAAKPLNLWRLAFRPAALSETIGPFSIETWVSTNDPLSGVKESKLWGIAVGARPFSFLELSLLELYQFGGVGAPGLEGADYFGMLGYSNDAILRNKRQRNMAIDLGIWGPSEFFKFYGQLFFDSLQSSDGTSYLAGLWLPKLGSLEFRLEYVNTAKTAYQDPFWTQGLTYQGTPLGHPLGPDAEGSYVDLEFPLEEASRLLVSGWYERRAKSKTSENRTGMGLGWIGRWIQTEVSITGRYFHIENPQYLTGAADDAASALVTLRYSFL